MSEDTRPKADIVSAKRVRRGEQDLKGRDQIVLTFGPDKTGREGAQELAEAINKLASEGKQINFDIRIGKQEGARGKSFDTAFVLIKEMVPLNATSGTQVAYKAKQTRQEKMVSNTENVKKQVES